MALILVQQWTIERLRALIESVAERVKFEEGKAPIMIGALRVASDKLSF